MSSKVKLVLAIFIAVVVAFVFYHTYNYGYTNGYTKAESYYLQEFEKLRQSQEDEQKRVSELEQQLFEASKKYEQLSSSFSAVQKENERWKKQTKDAQKEALVSSTVNRLNEILSQYSSSH